MRDWLYIPMNNEILRPPRRFLNPQELAGYLGVPVGWIYDRTKQKGPETIPHIKLGKYLRFNPESEGFQRWLTEHEINSELTADSPVHKLPAIEDKTRAIKERSM